MQLNAVDVFASAGSVFRYVVSSRQEVEETCQIPVKFQCGPAVFLVHYNIVILTYLKVASLSNYFVHRSETDIRTNERFKSEQIKHHTNVAIDVKRFFTFFIFFHKIAF